MQSHQDYENTHNAGMPRRVAGAERKKQRVQRFSSRGKKKGTFIDDLPDMPEFLVNVP